MTNSTQAREGHPLPHSLPHDLDHCPQCGSELQSGTNDSAFECQACAYTEQGVVA
jgi:tRNA(Ile2) C34 agmatinyltransferase TiaS